MNKYITPLTENEALACQNDCLNPAKIYPSISAANPRECDSSFLWFLEV
jgi:hypothetical protein